MSQKLSQDEINSLTKLQQEWNFLTQKSGELHQQKRLIKLELSDINNKLDQLETDKYSLVDELEKKYGQGQINLVTGEFIPDPIDTTL